MTFSSCIKKGDTAVQEGSRLFQAGDFDQARAALELALTEDLTRDLILA